MKKRQSQVDLLIDLLLTDFRNGVHLPFDVIRQICPDKNKKCKMNHADAVIKSYNKETDKFHVEYYKPHSSISYSDNSNIEEGTIKRVIKSMAEQTYTGSKPFLAVKDLKKLVDTRKINRVKSRSVRLTPDEDEMLKRLAKERGMEVCDMIRSKLFPDKVLPLP